MLGDEVSRLRSLVEQHPRATLSERGEPVAPVSHAAWQKEEDVDEQEAWTEQVPEPQTPLSIRGASEDLIRKALERHDGNRKKAAEELGISERTLYRKLPPEYRSQNR